MNSNISGPWQAILDDLQREEDLLRRGGGDKGAERQKNLKRMTARQRLRALFDVPENTMEWGLWAGYKLYTEWGDWPAAGVITAVGSVSGRMCMVIANDATVKAGALVPQGIKKILRAQRFAYQCRLPLLYLVDSAGVFLPLQDEVFPDEDDFGRIFRNNSVLSAFGIPQIAAIMGNCIAGGAYLPVLCDTVVMTEGSGLYLAGPALVKAAIGQEATSEELGGAAMHSGVSGTADFIEKDDEGCLKRLKRLVALLPEDPTSSPKPFEAPKKPIEAVYSLIDPAGKRPYDTRILLELLADDNSIDEYKQGYGQTLITAFARIEGIGVGIVANQRALCHTALGEVQIGGVLYSDSADKAARFVMDCNQMALPLIFLQDVTGFMVGKHAEQGGIIRSGAKLVNAISNTVVPKFTVIIGNAFGAGHYALCGKAYDPHFIAAWPTARYAVMGSDQAAATLQQITKGTKEAARATKESYNEQIDIRYGAARGWVDAIIAPKDTRPLLSKLLKLSQRKPISTALSFHTGVLQV